MINDEEYQKLRADAIASLSDEEMRILEQINSKQDINKENIMTELETELEQQIKETESKLVDLYLQFLIKYDGIERKLSPSQYGNVFEALKKGFESVTNDGEELYFEFESLVIKGLDNASQFMDEEELDIVTQLI